MQTQKTYRCLVFCPRFKYFNALFEDIFSSILIKSISNPETRGGKCLVIGEQLNQNKHYMYISVEFPTKNRDDSI